VAWTWFGLGPLTVPPDGIFGRWTLGLALLLEGFNWFGGKLESLGLVFGIEGEGLEDWLCVFLLAFFPELGTTISGGESIPGNLPLLSLFWLGF